MSLLLAAASWAQTGGTLRGRVTLEANGDRLAHADVLLVQAGRHVETSAGGEFEFRGLAPGRYDVLAHMHPLIDERKQVEVAAGGVTTVDFALRLAPMHEHITVTASAQEETTFESFQAVATVETLDLASKAAASLGDALERETGVAKRSFGPGASRPVIRGFDGDRVAILQDGMSTGTLSSQSGDHAEPVDVTSVERIEVVRGPATLLYGSNAIGGVVNVISGHHEVHAHAHPGVRGSLAASAGSANALGGGNGSFEAGSGKWLLSGGGGALRTGDYHTPAGTVENSHTRIAHTAASIGRFDEKRYFRLGYGVYDGRYGIPPVPAGDSEAGPVDEKWRRHNLRLSAGFQELGRLAGGLTLQLNYSDWNHKEMAEEHIQTEFFNRVLGYRGVFDQAPRGRWSGRFGFQGQYRDYSVIGEEALTPPVRQNSVAAFALEEFRLERFRLQLGGRVENSRYSPHGLRPRSFTGFSGSAGLHAPLWKDGAFVASFSHSYRAPAIEELYNVGPHPGNLAYEVGNPDLRRERGDGAEVAVRQQSRRLRGEAGVFYYRLKDYVYLAPTGVFQSGFVKANYAQGDSRYLGGEGRMELAVYNGVWLRLGFDSVSAQLRPGGTPLPRIPPVRARIGADVHLGGLSLRPELVLARPQQRLFSTETRTAGYATAALTASYTLARSHRLHSIGADLFNLNNRLYRNHVSPIKDFAPETGRGIRFNYTLRFF
ncbi:MAG: TonB-dependent receptor [Acidobacteria bacterium]|nr:TonB-dependent receptor [Acidobacteriota bacterium]